MMRSGTWCAAIGAGVMLSLAACGSDQSTNSTTPPPLTAVQLALHFDTLAKNLSVSSPGDIRIQWYQEMVRVLARGASPSLLPVRVSGGPSEAQGLTEIDQFPTALNAKLTADSTYILELYNPPLRPTAFIDVHVWFLPYPGHTDTTRVIVTAFLDTLGHQATDTTETVALSLLSQRGTCALTTLAYLTVPTNPCVKADVEWAIGGGSFLLSIDPALEVPGVHFSATP